jgi:acetyltransferase-like isoleucine patch superfamily enzyme
VPKAILEDFRLYGDLLPVGARIAPYSSEQRLLHFIWDAFDKTPLSMITDFSIPFRRLIAERIFKECGKNFICESGVSFNYGNRISAGNNVFINRNVFLDSKGFIEIGDGAGFAEDVRIFTHTHNESDHTDRTYKKVVIKDFALIFSGASIMPGVTVGEQAIVAGRSVVTHDVPQNTMVAGSPAKVVRDRQNEGKMREGLKHIWLADGKFQDEERTVHETHFKIA